LREIRQAALPGVQQRARAGIGQRGDHGDAEQAFGHHAPRLPCSRCAASNAASCSGVASLWCFAFHCANGSPVNRLARLVLAHREAARFRGFAIPVGQAVAAEAGQDHQVDVLHVGAVVHEVL
jgi:hypothetical protein